MKVENWKIVSIGDVATIVGGGTPSTLNSAYWNGDIQWFTPAELSDSKKYVSKSERTITERGLKESSAKLLPKGTVLLTTRASIGITAILENSACTNQGFQSLIAKDICCNEFLYYVIPLIKDEMLSRASGSTFAEISAKKLSTITFQLPPLAEQQRIAKALSDVDALISTTEKLIQKKKNIKQGTMQNLLTGKKRLPGFGTQTKSPTYKQTELGPIPEDWEVKSLETLCKNITDGSHVSPPEVDNGYYMPSVKDMKIDGFDFSDCKKISRENYENLVRNGCKPEVGDVLIAKDGSILKYCFAVRKEESIVILSSIAILKPKQDLVDSEYLAKYFQQTDIVKKVIDNYKSGTGVPRIILNNFKNIPLIIPTCKEEQTAIANVLSSMDKEIETLNTKLEKYRNLKTAMMQQLLTGKIRL